jgi:integrase
MGMTLLLRDSKGRGGSRDHLLPLTAFSLEQLKPLREVNGNGSPPFSSDGKRGLVVETLSDAVRGVSKRLKREQSIPKFGQRDLRRTAETMLQKMGIDREVRAHLLSHGRTKGVQGKHYERYDFLTEKRAALEKWARHLERIITGKAAKVVAIKGGAA